MFFQNCTCQFWVTVACTCQFSAILILTTTFLHFAHSQKFTVTFITKMCLSPAHFHQFLHPSIDSHYEGPAKSGMIVEIQGHPKHLLMPNCLGIVINVPQTITIFVGVRIFLWAYIVCPYKISCGRTWAYMGVHCTPTKNCWNFFCGRTCTPMGVQLCGRTNFLWAYNVRPCTPMGVLGVLGVICGRTGRTWAYKGVHGRNIAGAS